jgi:methanogenic corrinoid protein MtbC1
VYVAGRICEDLCAELLPGAGPPRVAAGSIAIAVLEDHHLLGKRLVTSVLRAAGWPVQDLGHGMTAEALAARVAGDGVRLLLVSTLMLRAALQVGPLVRALRAAGAPVRVVVGGAPFRLEPGLWRELGADAMGANASEALGLVERWAAERR